MNIRYYLILIILYVSINTYGQNAGRNAQFNFWLGEWTVEWTDQNGNLQQGTNSVKKILGGKVIEENFSTENFKGKSLSVYNEKKEIWQQTWIDNNGGYMTFTGGLEEDKMILYWDTIDKEGKPVKFRMIFFDIEKDKLTWNWEKSLDQGSNWILVWKLNYKRK